MVSTAALIAALQGQFSAARQAQGGGANSSLPGLLGAGNGEGDSGVNALVSGGIASGGVPGTATTGASIASGLGGGGAPELTSLDPLTQQVLSGLTGRSREPGERGDLGADVSGGDVDTLLSILGGPLAIPAVLGSLVGSADLGLPPTTSINSLLSSSREIGVNPQTDNVTTNQFGARVNNIRSGVFRDPRTSDRRDRGPGSGPNRGAPGAGNRGR